MHLFLVKRSKEPVFGWFLEEAGLATTASEMPAQATSGQAPSLLQAQRGSVRRQTQSKGLSHSVDTWFSHPKDGYTGPSFSAILSRKKKIEN